MLKNNPQSSSGGEERRNRRLDRHEVQEQTTMYLGALRQDMKKEQIAVMQKEASKVMPVLQQRLGKDAEYIQGMQLDVMEYFIEPRDNVYHCQYGIDARCEFGGSADTARRTSVDIQGVKFVPVNANSIKEVIFSAEELVSALIASPAFQEEINAAKKRERSEKGAASAFEAALEMKAEQMLPILKQELGEDAYLLGDLQVDVNDLQFGYANTEKENDSLYYNMDVYVDMAGEKKKFTLASDKMLSQDAFGPGLTPRELALDLLASNEFQVAIKEAKVAEKKDERLAQRSDRQMEKKEKAFKSRLNASVGRALAKLLPNPSYLDSIEFDPQATVVNYDQSRDTWDVYVHPTVQLHSGGRNIFLRGNESVSISKLGSASEIAVTPNDIAEAILHDPSLRLDRAIADLEADSFKENDPEAVAIQKKLRKGKEKLGDFYKLWKKSKDTGNRGIAVSQIADELKADAAELKADVLSFVQDKAEVASENEYIAEAISNIEEEVTSFDDEVAVETKSV